jgi:hypothetical protein
LGKELENIRTELASLNNEISSLIDSQNALIQDLENMASNQVYNGQQWIQKYLATVRSTSNCELNNFHRFLTESFLVPTQNLALQLQEAENQELNLVTVNQLQQKLDVMKTFETTRTDGLLKHQDSLLQHVKQQQQALEISQEGYRGMDRSLSGFDETFVREVQELKSWADHILGIHVNFENQCNDRKN